MALFEVFIPAKDAASTNVTLTLEAPNWIGALKSGLKSIGEGQEAVANVMCDIKEDNSIHVTDVASSRVFRLREVPPAGAPKADPPTLLDTPVERTQAAPPRPVSMPEVPAILVNEPTLKNPLPASGDAFTGGPKTLLQFQAPTFPTPAAKPATPPAVSEDQHTMQIAASPGMPPPAPAPAAPAPAAAAPSPAPARAASPASAFVEDTQKIPIAAIPPAAAKPAPTPAPAPAPAAAATPQPLAKVEVRKGTGSGSLPASGSAPTPRGVPAPAPKRPSGQFQNAPAPTTREESQANPKTDPAIGRIQPLKSATSITDAIAEVFDATQDLYLETQLTAEKVAEKMLDIALAHIPAESGTFYLADVNGHELSFAAVRGPKAAELKRSGVKVKVGQGIIGFCAQEGICLLVSDIQKDPRYYSQIASSIGYQPRDTVCASAEKDGRLFGALQLINAKDSKVGFDAAHMEVARYIGLTAAALLDRLDG